MTTKEGTIRRTDLEAAVIGVVQRLANPPDDWLTNHKTRKRGHVQCRQMVMTVLHTIFNYDYARTASVFGKDHATGIHARRTMDDLYETDPAMRALLNDIYAEANRLPFKRKPKLGRNKGCCLHLRLKMVDELNREEVTPDDPRCWFIGLDDWDDVAWSEEKQMWEIS